VKKLPKSSASAKEHSTAKSKNTTCSIASCVYRIAYNFFGTDNTNCHSCGSLSSTQIGEQESTSPETMGLRRAGFCLPSSVFPSSPRLRRTSRPPSSVLCLLPFSFKTIMVIGYFCIVIFLWTRATSDETIIVQGIIKRRNTIKNGAYPKVSEKFKAKNIKLWSSEVLHFSFYVLHFLQHRPRNYATTTTTLNACQNGLSNG